MATPSARGTARSRANSDEASVPKIIGAAPNTPATGSHTDVHRKVPPKRWIAGQALTTSSLTSASSSSGSTRASVVSTVRYNRSARFVPRSARQRGSGAATGSIGTVVMGRNVSSFCHETVTPGQKNTPRRRIPPYGGERQSDGGLPSCRRPDRLTAGGDRLQTGLDPRPQLLGQRRVAERLGLRLTLGLGPPDELHQRAGFRGVVVFLAEQEPREACDRIGLVPLRVRDGHAEVGARAHRLHRPSRGGGHALECGRDELAGSIPDTAGRQLVGHRVAELDVADRPRRLLHGRGDALIALAPQPDRPVDRRAATHLLIPFRAHLRQAVVLKE